MIVDRRSGDWEAVRAVFSRVVSLFPARIRHLYLLSHCVDKVRTCLKTHATSKIDKACNV